MQPEVLYQVTEDPFNEIREWLREAQCKLESSVLFTALLAIY
ncbi:hypothetical protein N7E81_10990 [Reichenbachiella carrageenanivorans]|uniref:Uncharacterized protein n=1 Tax=Reichenbachiella carrageenanivorans TaxID=2979869 RepID=A0ABY6CYI7_9BACT|nr:hypothetical protein [Reichenbachiella carrageenanivorans]UXX77893.1 hypothetical protein N7E81_10990 [Reichenbachiella carrageenanivorans]